MKEKNEDKSVSKCQLRDGGKRRYEGYASFVPLRREWIVVVQKGRNGRSRQEERRMGGCEGGTVFDSFAVVLSLRPDVEVSNN